MIPKEGEPLCTVNTYNQVLVQLPYYFSIYIVILSYKLTVMKGAEGADQRAVQRSAAWLAGRNA
jgi:hypothetical protein